MFPTPDFLTASFLAALIPAFFLGVAIHELGHTIAGSVAGFHIAATGIGFGRPLLHVRFFGIVFYVAMPLHGGLTVPVWEELFPRRIALASMILGGPAASLIGAFAAAWVWRLVPSNVLAATFYVSGFMALGTLVPHRSRMRQTTFRSDGLLALQFLRGTAQHAFSPGEQIEAMQFLLRLCRPLDAWRAVVNCSLSLALYQALVGDTSAAEQTLNDQSLRDPRRVDFAQTLEKYVRAVLAVAVDANAAQVKIAEARECCDEPAALAALSLLAATAAIETSESAEAALQEARLLARRAGQPRLETEADALLLELAPPEDVLAAYRALSARRAARRPTHLVSLRLACAFTKTLVERGRLQDARTLFHEATDQLRATAAAIRSEETREKFVALFSQPLCEAAGLAPLFVPLDPAKRDSKRRRPWSRIAWTSFGVVSFFMLLLVVLALSVRIRHYKRELANSYSALADSYSEQGYYETAAQTYRLAAETRASAAGEEDGDVAEEYLREAIAYLSAERQHLARVAQSKSLSILETAPRRVSWSLAAELVTLARMYVGMEHYVEAEPLYEHALTVAQQDDATPAEFTRDVLEEYAKLLQTIKRADQDDQVETPAKEPSAETRSPAPPS